MRVLVEGVETGRHTLGQLEISARLGETPRHIRLPDGGKFETRDNAGVDGVLRRHGAARGHGLIHSLESHYLIAVVSLVLVVLLGVLFFTHGVPTLSRVIAFNLPQSVTASVGEGTFALLDERLFEASELSAERREGLRRDFKALTAGLDERFKLKFRGGGEVLGANAFALPDGTVVLTDELVALAESDREILAVLAHEAGHVTHRHGLRQVLQQSLVSLFVIYVTGDASNLVAMIPSVLVQMGYSRAFEREADRFALELMGERGIEAHHFATILRKIEAEHRGRGEDEGDGVESEVFAYLSTHPPTEERVQAFLR